MKKYFEIISIPVAVVLLLLYNHVAHRVGLHVFTWEMFGKVFVAFLMFLVALGFIRIVFAVMFDFAYRYFDPSFQNHKTSWEELKPTQKVFYSLALFYVLSDLFKVIVNGL
jgi:hypothetical protein